jgi:hypothetical protein
MMDWPPLWLHHKIEKKKKYPLLWSGVIICSFVPGVLVNPWALTPCTLKEKEIKEQVLTIE